MRVALITAALSLLSVVAANELKPELQNRNLCPNGKYFDLSSFSCKNCPAGTYGQSGFCPSCPAGKISNPGSTSCTPCPGGSVPASNKQSCSTCPRNTFSSGNNCSPCPAGSTSNPGSSSCGPQPSGQPTRRSQTCQRGTKLCSTSRGPDCVNIMTALTFCGGCVAPEGDKFDNDEYSGRDCSIIPNTDTVSCVRGKCVIESCIDGYEPAGDVCLPIAG